MKPFLLLILLAAMARATTLTFSSTASRLFSENQSFEVGASYRVDPSGNAVEVFEADELSGTWILDAGLPLSLPAGSLVNSVAVTFSDLQAMVLGPGTATATLDEPNVILLGAACAGTVSGIPRGDSVQFDSPCPADEVTLELNMGGTADLVYVPAPVPTEPGIYTQEAILELSAPYVADIDYTAPIPEPSPWWLAWLGVAGMAVRLRSSPAPIEKNAPKGRS